MTAPEEIAEPGSAHEGDAVDEYAFEDEPDTRPLSRAAARGLLFALLPFAVNILSNIIGRIGDAVLTGGSPSDPWFVPLAFAETGFVLVSRLIIAIFLILAFGYGYAGLRETKDGTLRGRTRAIWAVVLGYIDAALLILSLVNIVSQFARGVVEGIQ